MAFENLLVDGETLLSHVEAPPGPGSIGSGSGKRFVLTDHRLIVLESRPNVDASKVWTSIPLRAIGLVQREHVKLIVRTLDNRTNLVIQSSGGDDIDAFARHLIQHLA
jgi:hypothetical protein